MSGKAKKIFSIIVGFVMGIFFVVAGTKEFQNSKQLAASGKTITGKVLDGQDRVSGRLFRSHTYYLNVSFQTEDQITHEERARVSKAVFNQSDVGDVVTVHYLAEDPSVCQVGETVELRYKNILWGIFFICVSGYLVVNFGRPNAPGILKNAGLPDATEAAQKLSKTVQTLSIERFEYISVKAENFKHLDLAFYDEIRRALESRGFVFLDDQENVTLRQRSGINTFLRCLLGGDKSTMAAIYHFVPKPAMRMMGGKSFKVLDLETWLSDGTFICTNNAQSAGRLNSPPAIAALHMHSETTWDMLLQTHERRLKEYLNANPGTATVKLGGMADYRRAQAEMQRIKSEFRKQTGLSKAELERFAGGPNEQVDRIHDELVKRREQGA